MIKLEDMVLPNSGDSRMKKVGGELRGQGKSRGAT